MPLSIPMPTKEEIITWLDAVKDPEIPVLSLVDLGVITDIQIEQPGSVSVRITPTFSGCPAIDVMRQGVEDVLVEHGIVNPSVTVAFDIPWSSDRISERGLAALAKFGLALPNKGGLIDDIDVIEAVACPHCGSMDTETKSWFGPTLCRSLHYCHHCLQAFERFKPL